MQSFIVKQLLKIISKIYFVETVLMAILSTEVSRGDKLPSVAELMAMPLFSIQEKVAGRTTIKISTSTKEAVRKNLCTKNRTDIFIVAMKLIRFL